MVRTIILFMFLFVLYIVINFLLVQRYMERSSLQKLFSEQPHFFSEILRR